MRDARQQAVPLPQPRARPPRPARPGGPFRAGSLLPLLPLLALLSAPALGAELHLRESLLEAQRNRITTTFTAVVDHLGNRAHGLSDDCDLHVPLRSREIRVPFIGELKNACSMKPAGTTLAYWSDQLYEATHGLSVPVTGVFRIWLEHPPTGDAVQTEAERVPWYADSNPDHQVELHPLLQVGPLDFRGHVKRIETATARYEGSGPARLPTILRKQITIQRIDVHGEPYIRIRGTKTGNNHWDLRGRVVQAAEALPDGVGLRVDILDDDFTTMPEAVGLPVVAVTGTVGHAKAEPLSVGAVFRFQALIRMHLPIILDEVDQTPRQIPLPVEFVLLDIE